MTYGIFSNNQQKQIAICSVSGLLVIVSRQGKLLQTYQLRQKDNHFPAHTRDANNQDNAHVIATPISASLSLKSYDEIIIASDEGNIYLYNPHKNQVTKQYATPDQIGFRSSPILFDLNLDQYLDIIVANAQGKIFFIDGKNFQPLIKPYSIGFSMTASPLVSDIKQNGVVDFILAGENGELVFLHLEPITKKKNIFQNSSSLYPQDKGSYHFLINNHNHNHFP